MTIQCDHVIEAISPDMVVVEKENNKAIIVDIASPWGHWVYEKEGEKIEKYQELKREIGKLWGIRYLGVEPLVVGALGVVSKRLDAWFEKLGIPDYHQNGIVAENSHVRHSKDSKEAVGKLKEKKWRKGLLPIGYGSILWCNVHITSARAKVLHHHRHRHRHHHSIKSWRA